MAGLPANCYTLLYFLLFYFLSLASRLTCFVLSLIYCSLITFNAIIRFYRVRITHTIVYVYAPTFAVNCDILLHRILISLTILRQHNVTIAVGVYHVHRRRTQPHTDVSSRFKVL